MAEQEGQSVPAGRRLVSLDVLRLVAVLLVLGRHMPDPPAGWHGAGSTFFLAWHEGGWVGVDLFFVLSGFLVSGLLFSEYARTGELSIGRFYMRRGWKIYPAFYALMAASLIVIHAGGYQFPPSAIASELLFVQSYVPGIWNHTWSLAVEEHFYLVLPLLLALMLSARRGTREPFRPIIAVSVTIAVASLVLRLLNAHYRDAYTDITHLFATHLRIDSLFFGVVISYLYRFHAAAFVRLLSPWRLLLIATGALLMLPPFFFRLDTTPLLYTVGLTVLYVASGMILIGMLLTDASGSRLLRAAARIGAYSYSIYLWHMPVRAWILPAVSSALGVPLRFGAAAALFVTGSLALGVIMGKLIEMPALRLRDRWFPTRAAAIPSAGSPA